MSKIPRLLALSVIAAAIGSPTQESKWGAGGHPASDEERQRRRDAKAGRAPALIAKAEAKRQRKATRRAQARKRGAR